MLPRVRDYLAKIPFNSAGGQWINPTYVPFQVQGFLSSPNWDTRIAATHAVESIAKNVPQWKPSGAVKEEAAANIAYGNGRLSFQYFNIQRVLVQGASLLASQGDEYDIAEENMCKSPGGRSWTF